MPRCNAFVGEGCSARPLRGCESGTPLGVERGPKHIAQLLRPKRWTNVPKSSASWMSAAPCITRFWLGPFSACALLCSPPEHVRRVPDAAKCDAICDEPQSDIVCARLHEFSHERPPIGWHSQHVTSSSCAPAHIGP